MAATFVPRLLLVLCLFCVLIHADFSRQGKVNLKESLMQMLGRKLPDSSQNVSISPPAMKSAPDYLIKLLNTKTNATARRGNTVYGFTDNGGSSDRRFKFNVTLIRTKLPRFAELLLYKFPSALDTNQNATATVYINDVYSGKQLSTQRVSIATTGWISFNVPLEIIRRWDRNPASNAGIAVQVTELSLAPSIRFATSQTDPDRQVLFLLHYSDSGFKLPLPTPTINKTFNVLPKHRSPRSVHPNHRGPCQRHKLDVYFKDLGWDEWVIAPKMYSAYYCAGKCDISKMKTNHAGVQMFLSQNEPEFTDGPCCTTDQLGSISMLFYGHPGESAYVLQDMEEFVVETCGCF